MLFDGVLAVMQEGIFMSKRQNAFMGCHPVVQFLYFAVVILTTMLVDHPVILVLSFLGAFFYNVCLSSFREVLKTQLSLAVPLFLLVVLINTLFNHYGVTVLCYIHTGAVTLESLVYGIVLAFMLWIAIVWFAGVNVVLTTDRMIYLFGRMIPVLSLVISMVLRFVPRFTRQFTVIRENRKGIGMDGTGKGFGWKVRNALQEFSILMTWSLEHGVDTADSMRARGYGVQKRTFYAVFKPCRRDFVAIILLLLLYSICLFGFWRGYAYANYNPKIIIHGLSWDWDSVITYLSWGIFCLFPTLLGIWDDFLLGEVLD